MANEGKEAPRSFHVPQKITWESEGSAELGWRLQRGDPQGRVMTDRAA